MGQQRLGNQMDREEFCKLLNEIEGVLQYPDYQMYDFQNGEIEVKHAADCSGEYTIILKSNPDAYGEVRLYTDEPNHPTAQAISKIFGIGLEDLHALEIAQAGAAK
jgi:hypothetical protein